MPHPMAGSKQYGVASVVGNEPPKAKVPENDIPPSQSFQHLRRNAVASLPAVVQTGILYLLVSASTCPSGQSCSKLDGNCTTSLCHLEDPLPKFSESNLYTALTAWTFDISATKKGKRERALSAMETVVKPKKRKPKRSPLTEKGKHMDALAIELAQDEEKDKAHLSSEKSQSTGAEPDMLICPTIDVVQIGRNRTRINSGKTYTVTDKLELRYRRRSDTQASEGVIPYPQYPPQFASAARNSGPLPSSALCSEIEVTRCEFGSDLYTPRFIRRSGKREEGSLRMGFCSLCTPSELESGSGGWYSLKRSQYLYHLQFEHGVSSTSRRPFSPPVEMRIWNDDEQTTDGRCGVCGQWVAIAFGPVRKRGWKAWWKHAVKCHRSSDTGRPI